MATKKVTVAPKTVNAKSVSKKATNKKVEPKKEVVVPVKVALCTSSYHYYRGYVKDIIRKGGVNPSFKKEAVGYNGTILVLSTDLVKAKNILDTYNKENPDVCMWDF